MTTNPTAYLGCIARDGYVIKAAYKGHKDRVIAWFPTHDEMVREWLRITDLCDMVDVYGSKFD
ncbi:hypothetical protein [Mycolicibacterium rhodesiae]|uniref:Uncharacterized protein n=1 Tax=Mycolicibacterium rhodesiae TaxID=36814 RepID=A0A1X0IQR5_MYCRH|nr:hypothetical protein [Mycolicibacterium rhodesiae]MCV7346991.1 hypothetical protein [Mycolicibacterium rhodesiae]ORB50805.1 hypothetical protein BST42_18740 [Mycolicibacterium rhodesiae]